MCDSSHYAPDWRMCMSVMAALGVLGGIVLLAVVIVVAVVAVTVTGAFNSIKYDEI